MTQFWAQTCHLCKYMENTAEWERLNAHPHIVKTRHQFCCSVYTQQACAHFGERALRIADWPRRILGQCHFFSSTRFEVNNMESDNEIRFILSEIDQYFMVVFFVKSKGALWITEKFFNIICYYIIYKLDKNRCQLFFISITRRLQFITFVVPIAGIETRM
jgi:hypothetical protein